MNVANFNYQLTSQGHNVYDLKGYNSTSQVYYKLSWTDIGMGQHAQLYKHQWRM